MGTVTFTAKDKAGNTATRAVSVTVSDPIVTRNWWDWPGDVNSPWNWPITDRATYDGPFVSDPYVSDNWGVDPELIGRPTDPLVELWKFNKGGTAADGTSLWAWPQKDPSPVDQGIRLKVARLTTQTMPSWDQNTPNSASGLPDANGQIHEGNYWFHMKPPDVPTERILAGAIRGIFDPRGMGIPTSAQKGGHGGSMLPGYFGCILVGNLTGPNEILHAMKLTMCLRLFGTIDPATGENAWEWPAITADKPGTPGFYGNGATAGCTPNLKSGSLIAIPYTTDVTKLGLTTPVAQKIARAAQRFGFYVVDECGDPSWKQNLLCAEWGVVEECAAVGVYLGGHDQGHSMPGNPWGQDMDRIIKACRRVKNNTAATPAGGGTPRYATAPPLA